MVPSDSLIGLAVPHLRLFLILSVMPLKRCVATENDLTALFKDPAQNKIFDVNSRRALTLFSLTPSSRLWLPLDGAEYILYLHPAIKNFPYEVMRKSSSI